MKGPVPDRVFEHITRDRTGTIAMTTPGECYNCPAEVDGEPLARWTFDETDITLSVWICDDCYYTYLDSEHADWNDASNNV